MSPRARGPRGFSLLELLAVVALLALLATAIGLRLGGSGAAKLQTAVQTVITADGHARQLVDQQSRPVRMRIDLDNGWFELEWLGDAPGSTLRQTRLPSGVHVDRMISSREKSSSGHVAIDYRLADSDTFAVKLTAGRNRAKWVVIAGGTGAALHSANHSTLKEPSPGRPDAAPLLDSEVEAFFRSLRKGERLLAD